MRWGSEAALFNRKDLRDDETRFQAAFADVGIPLLLAIHGEDRVSVQESGVWTKGPWV